MSLDAPVSVLPNAPTSDIDLFSDEALLDPYPLYRSLRDQAGAVWLRSLSLFAVMRHADVKAALRDWQTFSSAQGVGLNPAFNGARNMLQTDPPEHDRLRAVIGAPVTMAAVGQLTEQIQAEADRWVASLVERERFDGVCDFAWHLPLTIVSRWVGLPEEGRQQMLTWSEAVSNLAGPLRAAPSPAYATRTAASIEVVQGLFQYLAQQSGRDQVQPDCWAARLYAAADEGKIPAEAVPLLLLDYIGPALETTIGATGTLLSYFARHPDQWQAVRDDAALIPGAVMEAVRIGPPLPYFTRVTTRETEIDGTVIPAGSRVMLGYASANRDERVREDPERFDVRRNTAQHLGFGHGVHACMGMHLARLEMGCLFKALRERVSRIELDGEPQRGVFNNGMRAYRHLPVRVVR